MGKKSRPTAPRANPPLSREKIREIELAEKRNKEISILKNDTTTLKVSIITPVYNVNIEYFKETVKSVLDQTYKNIEWCICSDGVTDKDIIAYLLSLQTIKNIKIKFLEKNVGISEASNTAVSISSGEILAFLDHDDILHPDAIKSVVDIYNGYDMDIVYTDEAMKRMDGKEGAEHLKPNFSPHYLLSSNYICHLLCVRKELFNRIGGYRIKFDGAQDHDLILRLTDISKKIFHISKVLYQWRLHDSSFSSSKNKLEISINNGIKAVEDSFSRKNIQAKVKSSGEITHYTHNIDIKNNPKVNIVLVSLDTVKTKSCVYSILTNTSYSNYTVNIIVKNIDEIKNLYSDFSRIQIIPYIASEVNLPKMINTGIRCMTGEYIVVVHDDITIIQNNWIQLLIGYLQDPSVGVVGGKVIDENDKILEFGNIVGDENGEAPISPMFKGLHKDQPGNFRRAVLTQNTSTISSVTMAFRRDTFNKVNGMDELYNLYYFDFDFCLRVKEEGLFNVINPECIIKHDCINTVINLDKKYQARSIYENETLFRSKYNYILEGVDPYYNINFKKINDVSGNYTNTPYQNEISIKKNNITGLVSFIVPWYKQAPVAITSLLAQTYNDIEIIVVYDGPPEKEEENFIKSITDPRVYFCNTPIRYNDWGHTPRDYGLLHISNKSKAVIFTGADNYYLPSFTEEMYAPIVKNKNTIATYCNMINNKKSWNLVDTKLEFSKIDCGCFMIISEIANEFKLGNRVSWEDWILVEKIIKKYGSSNIIKVPRMLYIHN